MKKFTFYLTLCLMLLCLFSGCKKQTNPLYDRVSELRSDIYYGQSQTAKISASYGFKEFPYAFDKTVGQKKYLLTLRLVDADLTETSYSISLVFKGKEYSSTFKLSPLNNDLSTYFEIPNFDLKQFDVTLKNGSEKEKITLKSIVPPDTITYKKALDYLKKDKPTLLNAYTDQNGKFLGEIFMRVIVKDGASYWYVGIATDKNNLKALLIDGKSGKILAIREVF